MNIVNIEYITFQRIKKKEKKKRKKQKKKKINMQKKQKKWTQKKKCLINMKIQDLTWCNIRADYIEPYWYEDVNNNQDDNDWYEDDTSSLYNSDNGCNCIFMSRCQCVWRLHSNPYFCDDNWRQREEDSWESLRDKD